MSNVEGLNELRTFGWSLSGGVDVDNNQYGGKGYWVENCGWDQKIEGRIGGKKNEGGSLHANVGFLVHFILLNYTVRLGTTCFQLKVELV